MTGARRLSHAISEGDGISIVVLVATAEEARSAEAQGAEAIAVATDIDGLRDAGSLPVLGLADVAGIDALLLVAEQADDELEEHHAAVVARGLECVVDVHTDDELQYALERIEPEIFLISPRAAEDDDEPIERLLDLLPDVPAGKLAIAELPRADREHVAALERAGFDAVLVRDANVAGLVGGTPPEV